MPMFIIEREMPGAGSLSPDELKAAAVRSMGVLGELGPSLQWLQSYVVDDRIYCVYSAPSEGLIREHAKCARLPANRIMEVRAVIGPNTAGE